MDLAPTKPKLPPHRPRPPNAPKALDGLKVVDFTRMLAGPFATQQLADLGADVVKIETPGSGDDSRQYTTTSLGGECAFFLSTNRNKRSVTLDLKNPAGQEIARRLITRADILVENFSNGVMERLGLGYEALSAENPRLIYCSVSGYGRDEPAAVPRRAYDAMLQAGSGFMSLTGEPDRMPMRAQVPIIDTASALMATNAILGAVIARERLGRGQSIEVALIDVAVAILTIYGTSYLISGETIARSGNTAPQTAPSDAYCTADRPIFLTCGNNPMFRRMVVEGLGRPDIADDPAFGSNADRVRNRDKLTAVLQDVFMARPAADWIRILSTIGVPVSPVSTVAEAMASEDVTRRRILSEVPHPTAGSVPNVRSPFCMSLTPPADPVAPPLLGQHTREVLAADLGVDDETFDRFAARGAFGCS